jgi:hypothetical protein
MGEDEKRATRAAALLEYEEARAELALLRAKARQWHSLHSNLSFFLERMRRDEAVAKGVAENMRSKILKDREALAPALDLDAILALDQEITKTIARLDLATAEKKALGFVD